MNNLLNFSGGGGVHTLIHIAGIGKSVNVVKACLECNVKWVILVHTTGIYSKYKSAGEMYRNVESQIARMIKGRDISITILRPTMIYGDTKDQNIVQFIRMVDKLRVMPIVNHGAYELQPVWAKDLGEAYLSVFLHPNTAVGREFILSGGKPILLIDLLKVIQRKLGTNNCFISVPFWFAYSCAWLTYIASFTKIDYREKVQRLVEPRAYPHEEAREAFGYSPVCFEEGVTDEINQYKDEHKK